MGLLIALFGLSLAAALGFAGSPVVGSVVGGATLTTIVAAFVVDRVAGSKMQSQSAHPAAPLRK